MTAAGQFEAGGAVFRYHSLGRAAGSEAAHLIWAHGWGQDHRVFSGLAGQIERAGVHTLLDFPGFGDSPRPPKDWGTADYADAVATWLGTLSFRHTIWIGHSFGCRVGLQLAARHPDMVGGMILIAAAGLQRRRTPLQRLRLAGKVASYKLIKRMAALGVPLERWRDRFGSADYRSAGPMRGILVKVIGEDLTAVAARVACPVRLIYGSRDDETPPEMGWRLQKLIPNASLTIVEGCDHHTILTDGLHQILFHLDRFLKVAT
jgi:pimeloyl-ACP methyl ester carboxylesterase